MMTSATSAETLIGMGCQITPSRLQLVSPAVQVLGQAAQGYGDALTLSGSFTAAQLLAIACWIYAPALVARAAARMRQRNRPLPSFVNDPDHAAPGPLRRDHDQDWP